MSDASTLIREARTGAGLSMWALAALSDVSVITICRIEHDQVDPTLRTLRTLRKLLGAVGEGLELGRHSVLQSPQLASLADAWSIDRCGQERPDWRRMRAFLDHLERRPELAQWSDPCRLPQDRRASTISLLVWRKRLPTTGVLRARRGQRACPCSNRPGRALERHAYVARPLLALCSSSPCELF